MARPGDGFMVLAIVFSGAGAIYTSLAALYKNPPTTESHPPAPADTTIQNRTHPPS